MLEALQQRPLIPAKDIRDDLREAGVDTSSIAAERPGCEWSVAAGMVGDAGLCPQIPIVRRVR